ARREFVITPQAATPGYLPGELEAGTWQVMIGLYQLPPDGAEYRVTAEVSTSPGRLAPSPLAAAPPPLADGDRPPPRDLPAGPGRRWLAGDLHTHTVHSDGGLTVPELALLAARNGLDFLPITSHNPASPPTELPGARRQRQVQDHPAPGTGGHHVRGARGRARRHRLGGFPRAAGRVARPYRVPGRPAVGQPPDRRRAELDAADVPAPPARGGLALELAGPALDHPAGVVAGLGSRLDPGGRQRLASAE